MEIFNIVDENGNIKGEASREECHNGSKLLHPVVHIHIINSKGLLLLQKRAMCKHIQPGKWDTSVGGHISVAEKRMTAVIRESKEELGINIDTKNLKHLKDYLWESEIEREYVSSYIYKHDGKIKFQVEEIDEVKFYTKSEIKKLNIDGKTTPNFKFEFDLIINLF